jgi:hypothetical protein
MDDPDRMFDHRLGLALGKSLTEIRQMPIGEYESWKSFYLLEPFGWRNEELRTGALVATIVNVNRSRKDKVKSASDFARTTEDMFNGAKEYIRRRSVERQYAKMSNEEKKSFIRKKVKSWSRK